LGEFLVELHRLSFREADWGEKISRTRGSNVVTTGSSGSVSVDINSDGTVVVHGDIDIAGGPVLENAILEHQGDGPLAIDLADVSFIDSSGLRSLLNASRRAQHSGSHVVLRGIGPEVSRLLQITGTTERFVIEEPRD
jgi:anti-sigma B factor antagonist